MALPHHHISTTLILVSEGLPAAVADVCLELAADEAGDAVAEPEGAEHGVVAALVQVQLAAVAEAHVDLTVAVYVGRVAEGAGGPVQVQDAAAADVNVQPDVTLASGYVVGFMVSMTFLVILVRVRVGMIMPRRARGEGVEESLLSHMLARPADLGCLSPPTGPLLLHAADSLAAEDVAAEEAQDWVRDVPTRGRASALAADLDQCVVVLWQPD